MSRPYMTDPSLLASLQGQQYLVLRPVGEVASFYDETQSALRRRHSRSVTGPNTGHITLRGFSEPDRVSALLDELRSWAASQPPITVRVDAIDGFPPPFQVIIARVERSAALVAAYASLTAALDATDFHRIGELPPESWVLHLSLIYANSLTELEWDEHISSVRRDASPKPAETLLSADYVWYDRAGEHVESLPLAVR